MSSDELPIGTKHGCFTIIGGLSEYKEEIEKEIAMLSDKDRREIYIGQISWKFLQKSSLYYRTLSTFPGLKYQCQCKCGKIHYLSEAAFAEKIHRNCGKGCGRIPRKYHFSYNTDYTNTIFESLEILECIDDNVEELTEIYNAKSKRREKTHLIYKKYRCRCYLCGEEHTFRSDAFTINFDKYGSRAKDGYYSDTCCKCHKISSFQWRTIKILQKYSLRYRVEMTFPDLYGVAHKNLLRFDFAILDWQNRIKCLIESQGVQHYKPTEEFGGLPQYEMQVKNDELKRAYAREQGIPLIEVPYTCDTYDKEEDFLINEILTLEGVNENPG